MFRLSSAARRAAATGALAAAVTASLGACWNDDRPLRWERARNVIGPIALKAEVAYVDTALDRVVLVDLGSAAPALAHVAIGRRAITAVASPDRHRLYVLTRGEQAIRRGEIDEPPQLWLVDVQHPEVAAVGYPIGAPFDRIAVSPDGTRAIAYFSAAGEDADGFFRNPNELAVVDLGRAPDAHNPALVSVRSFGAVPDGIALSPPISLVGADPAPRTFAFILSADTLTVLDVSHPERREISIRLTQGSTPVRPREVVFAPETASAYVRSDGARDVLQVVLEAESAVPADSAGNDYRAVVAELGAGGGPTDVAVYDDAEGRRVVLASTPSTGEVSVIDAATGGLRPIAVPDPIDRILVFPGADGVPHQAVFAAVGTGKPRLYVLGLDHLDDPLAPVALTRIELGKPVRDVVAVPGRELAMVVHDDARTVLGMVDLATATAAPLLGVGKLDSYAFSPDGGYLIGATAGLARVGLVALDNFHPSDLRLDDAPVSVLATANGKVFVDHGRSSGRATILPSPGATRGDAVVLSGFLTADLFEEE